MRVNSRGGSVKLRCSCGRPVENHICTCSGAEPMHEGATPKGAMPKGLQVQRL